ncbi:MAG: DUF2027 domain-containing protein [Bacteroidia bacterium]|nr:DUF2027 domain-containing protein [Bacteroidia bacterium]
MNYRVGQRVRLLHESGTGIITNLIDKHTVEVDMGDDFPIDVAVDEIIPIDSTETAYLGKDAEQDEKITKKLKDTVQQLGTSLLDLSMVVVNEDEHRYALIIVNPEPVDILFTCYLKSGKRFEGIAAGTLQSGELFTLMQIDKSELNKVKAIYFQALQFLPGKGFPHAPLQRELSWDKSKLLQPVKYFKLLKKDGWAFSIRENKQFKDVKAIENTEFVKIRKADEAKPRPEGEVDLHIEELVKKPHLLKPSEMLKIQLEELKKQLDKAIMENYASLVVIHGVGEGKLKKEVHKLVKSIKAVKAFEQADLKKYGNGATKITFN